MGVSMAYKRLTDIDSLTLDKPEDVAIVDGVMRGKLITRDNYDPEYIQSLLMKGNIDKREALRLLQEANHYVWRLLDRINSGE